MNDQFDNFGRDSAAFQKIWVDTMSRMMKAAFTVTPDSVPPEILRQIRSAIFQALTESWNEFLRSPQFQEGMKQTVESNPNILIPYYRYLIILHRCIY